MKPLPLLAVLALLAAWPAQAQDEMPALPDEQPAVNTAPAPQPSPQQAPAPAGMTIIGEQESPIGLYIMPWRNSAAAGGLDRPARLLEEALLPLDPEVFRRQVEYHRALTRHLEKSGRATPYQ
jgi:hypothetical protein